jgi:predicted RNA-binding protein Jag
MLTKEYFEKIKETRAVVESIYKAEEEMVYIIESTEQEAAEPQSIEDLNSTAEYYLQQLLEDGVGSSGEPGLDEHHRRTREQLHGTADVVVLPDGWTLDQLAENHINMANMMDMLANEEV